MAMFPQHILDFISSLTPEANADEQMRLAAEQKRLEDEKRNQAFLQLPTANPQSNDLQLLKSIHGDEVPLPLKDESQPVEEPHTESNPLLNADQMKQFTLDLGNQGREIQRGLAEAQRARDAQILRHQINEAGKQIGAGISGAHEAPRGLDNMAIETAGNTIQDYLQKIKLDEQDPNSPISRAFKQYAQKYNVNVQGDFTAAMGKELLPFIFKSFEAEENRKNRQELMKLRTAEMEHIKQVAREDKERVQQDKDYMTLSEKISPEKTRGNTAFGRNANIYRAATALETMVGAYKNLNELSDRQIQELAKGLDSMLSAGGGTVSGTKALVPSSYSKDLNKLIEYVSNRRRGAGMKSFVSDIMDTVHREKANAKDQMVRTQGQLLSGYTHLYEKNPTRFRDFLIRNDLPEDILDKAFSRSNQETVSDKVKVMNPEGKPGEIPRSQLKDALEQGYKEIK